MRPVVHLLLLETAFTPRYKEKNGDADVVVVVVVNISQRVDPRNLFFKRKINYHCPPPSCLSQNLILQMTIPCLMVKFTN